MGQQEVRHFIKQGEDYFAQGNFTRAEEAFKSILEIQPNHTETLNNLGVIAFQEGRYDQASQYLYRALESDPAYPEAMENLAQCSMARGDFAEAVKILQKSFNAGRMDSVLFNLMAQCFIRLGDNSAARDLLNASLEKDPDQDDVRKLLAGIEEGGAYPTEGGLSSEASRKKLNIGFVSIWFERGQAYVTKILRDIIAGEHNAFLFARTGMVYGQSKLEKDHFWNVPNLTTHPDYRIPPEVLTSWIRQNDLDAVVFNEEYNWDLVRAVKSMGIKALTYLDYYKEEWKPFMGLYDKVLCSTLRTYHLVKDFCNAHYIGWAVDTELFRPLDDGNEKYTFFHNAGWLGINFRKMTPAVVLAFDAISTHLPDVTLFIHSQVDIDKLPPAINHMIRGNPRITYHEETVPAPGLYHKGRILVFPSKLEGLGLPLPEGLACGLPVIATNAPPMNEFVKDGYSGLLVDVAHRVVREDNVAFPETLVNVNDLAAKMAKLAVNPALAGEMSRNARAFVEDNLSLEHLAVRVHSGLNELF